MVQDERPPEVQDGTRPLSVLFVTRKWPPASGGMETYSRELTDELSRYTRLATRVLPGRANGKPPSLLAYWWFSVASFANVLYSARRFDVLHIGDLALWPLAVAARVGSRKIRVFASGHGTDIAYPLRPGIRPRIYGIYLKLGTTLAPRLSLIANSRATAKLCETAGYHVSAIIPLGVQADFERRPAEDPGRYLLFVGRLVRRKGCAWFIREVLPRVGPGVSLKVAGVEWDAEESAALRSDRVEYLGPVYGQALRELRRNAVAVVMPNISCGRRDFEGFGLAALEASADGGVLLAAELDGIVDAVVDGVTGFLLPAEDAASWAKCIQSVLEWPLGKRQAFTDRALQVVRDRYSWKRVARETLETYGASGY
ncbi:MAG TPA: glycosyltransferase family 4 protein [Gammaproteobacteria bacterium]|nr:glycosyltransferase family 4 protein [Gammaproteobacteria bacterium]